MRNVPEITDESTAQQIFDAAYKAVVKQGKKSLMKHGGCAYRGVNGTKCAVGHLISDEDAEKWDEAPVSSNIDDIVNTFSTPAWVKKNLVMLGEIQRSHDTPQYDNRSFVDVFKERMAHVAATHNLVIPELVTGG